MVKKLRRYLSSIGLLPNLNADLRKVSKDIGILREAVGRIEMRQAADIAGVRLADYEFRVFSQWGEDGIIQYIIRSLGIINETFIEFGVEAYRECNTRFLLMHDNWRGLIIDGGESNIRAVREEELYWRYDLTAVCSFITPSNINSIIGDNGFNGPIGLLSIDIDGMDYWVWKSITVVTAAIVVAEYNARFGPTRAVTVPLNESFTRSSAHYSNIYYGASIAALVKLGAEKGHSCVGCNSNGNNVFFVRRDLMVPTLEALSAEAAFMPCRFRESRDRTGAFTFLNEKAEREILDKLPLVEV